MNNYLKDVHRFSIYNQFNIQQSNTVGCFYCCDTMQPDQIEEWIEEGKGKDSTALCPVCFNDTLLPNNVVELSPELLHAMHDHYFKRGTNENC